MEKDNYFEDDSSSSETIVTLKQVLRSKGVKFEKTTPKFHACRREVEGDETMGDQTYFGVANMIKRLAKEKEKIFDTIVSVGEVVDLGEAAEFLVANKDMFDAILSALAVVKDYSHIFGSLSQRQTTFLGNYHRELDLHEVSRNRDLTSQLIIANRDVMIIPRENYGMELVCEDETIVLCGPLKRSIPNQKQHDPAKYKPCTTASLIHDGLRITSYHNMKMTAHLIDSGFELIKDVARKYKQVWILPNGSFMGEGEGSCAIIDYVAEIKQRDEIMSRVVDLYIPQKDGTESLFDLAMGINRRLPLWKAHTTTSPRWISTFCKSKYSCAYFSSTQLRSSMLRVFEYHLGRTDLISVKREIDAVILASSQKPNQHYTLLSKLDKHVKFEVCGLLAMDRTPIVFPPVRFMDEKLEGPDDEMHDDQLEEGSLSDEDDDQKEAEKWIEEEIAEKKRRADAHMEELKRIKELEDAKEKEKEQEMEKKKEEATVKVVKQDTVFEIQSIIPPLSMAPKQPLSTAELIQREVEHTNYMCGFNILLNSPDLKADSVFPNSFPPFTRKVGSYEYPVIKDLLMLADSKVKVSPQLFNELMWDPTNTIDADKFSHYVSKRHVKCPSMPAFECFFAEQTPVGKGNRGERKRFASRIAAGEDILYVPSVIAIRMLNSVVRFGNSNRKCINKRILYNTATKWVSVECVLDLVGEYCETIKNTRWESLYYTDYAPGVFFSTIRRRFYVSGKELPFFKADMVIFEKQRDFVDYCEELDCPINFTEAVKRCIGLVVRNGRVYICAGVGISAEHLLIVSPICAAKYINGLRLPLYTILNALRGIGDSIYFRVASDYFVKGGQPV